MTRKIGSSSIKESFDNLPSGICFADKNGIIVLCNHQMHRLCYELMGADLQHIFELREALSNPQRGVSVIDPSTPIIHFPNDRVWEFRESEVIGVLGESYTQIQAFDMTELYEKRNELEKENRRLIELNKRAKHLYNQLDQTVREEETFELKMSIHNRIGLNLLSTHQALTQKYSLDKLKELANIWKKELEMLSFSKDNSIETSNHNTEDKRTCNKVLNELKASASCIGVKLIIKGSLPSDFEKAYLLITVMRECVTNTVRHANGSEMNAIITETKDYIVLRITNNGRQPKKKIVEGGVLSDLRRRIEKASGDMQIKSMPYYQITVKIPRKEGKV